MKKRGEIERKIEEISFEIFENGFYLTILMDFDSNFEI